MKNVRCLARVIAAPVLAACLSVAALGAGQPASAATTPAGVFAFITANASMPSGIYTNPSVTGVTLATTWAELEPTQGNIDFSYFDAQIALAAQNGRQVALRVEAGVFSPKWLYKAGAKKFSLRWYLGGVLPQCSTQPLPLPWDPVYLSNLTQMITALGARYASNPNVTMVKLDGLNSVTGEMLLVFSAGSHSVGSGVCGAAPIAPVSAWQSAGYTPNKVTSAWSTIVSTYAASFPTQQLAVETGSWPFPPIDDSGQIIAGSSGDTQLVQTLDGISAQIIGDRFVLQSDALTTLNVFTPPPTVPADTLLADSPKTRITSDTGCLDNGGYQPCDPVIETTTMVANAKSVGAEFLEMFVVDLQNTQLASAIAGFEQ